MSTLELPPLDPAICVEVAPYDDLNWITLAAYRYVSRSVQTGRKIIVPKGFVTDGASVPRFFWRAIPPYGRHFNAAVVHDYLYRHHEHGMTRDECDIIFLEIMLRDGVPPGRINAMYRAVRAFGRRSWQDGKLAAMADIPAGALELPGADPAEVAEMLANGSYPQPGEVRPL